ncbi:hypothetical protein OJAV_G00049600 [Oryzias javanicus]|uniref:Centromere protein P n=1 Tax=Oryzias javanicus TaxID=123683 RepID=A0A3S2MDI4_ORYJA|nr:hypothetical protein OJAV_G00049600 [Oryzias javanicus]
MLWNSSSASDIESFPPFQALTASHDDSDIKRVYVPLKAVSLFLQDKFPSVVSVPGGRRSEVMVLRRPELPGVVLFIHWAVEISTEGTVVPKINLLPKIPGKALELFPSLPVGGAAEAFQSLLRILGAEGAVESVLRAVASPV